MSSFFCRHCGVIVLTFGKPKTLSCPSCAAMRLFKIRLPRIVIIRMIKEAARDGNLEAAGEIRTVIVPQRRRNENLKPQAR